MKEAPQDQDQDRPASEDSVAPRDRDDIMSNVELQERLIRMESQQDLALQKLDILQSSIQEDLDAVQTEQDRISEDHDKFVLLFNGLKWAAGTGGLLALGATVLL